MDKALDRSKKERIRRLGTLNNREKKNKGEMGGRHVSSSREVKQELEEEGEELLPSLSQVHYTSCCNGNGTGKRLKLPRKRLLELDHSNGVYCSSVPRKLRSAMKKRNRESPSFPNSKKLNGNSGVESPLRDVLKKPEIEVKKGVSDWSPRQSICGPITKDEEEVAEALYALAGMFPDNPCNRKRKLDDPSLDASLSASLDIGDVLQAAPEDIHIVKEETTTGSLTRHDNASQPEYNSERLLEGTATVGSLNDQELPSLPYNKQFNGESDGCVAQVSLETSQQPKMEEHSPLFNSNTFCIQTELHHDMGTLKQPAKLEVALLGGKLDVNLEMTTATGKQLDQLQASNESEKNALWPGLTSVESRHASSHGSSARSFATQFPRIDTALSAVRPVLSQNGYSIEKIGNDNQRMSWKRCATHLHMSRLIQKLQIAKRQDSLPLLPDQAREDRISNQAVSLTMNINEVKSGLNATRSGGVGPNAFDSHANDARGVFQQKILQQQKPASLSSGANNCQKQCFNFLSLSTGDTGLEASSDGMKAMKNGLEISKKLQFPPFCTHGPNTGTSKSMSMPQSYSASPFPNQPPPASPWQVWIQQSAYSGSPSQGPHTNPSCVSKQCHKQLLRQEQQQVFWATQLAARYRNTRLSMSLNQHRASANARPDLPTLTLCTQPDVPSSSLPIEVLSSKYHQISEHQQNVMTINSSLPRARMKWLDHHLSSSYEENGGGFQAGSGLPLQLLCNERL